MTSVVLFDLDDTIFAHRLAVDRGIASHLAASGVTTVDAAEIARWTERDIDEFDARLHEFPGRIRRDAWVTQARALHQSKFGESLPSRERH